MNEEQLKFWSGDLSRDPRRGEFKRYETADEMREYFRQLPAWQGKDDEMVRKNDCAQV